MTDNLYIFILLTSVYTLYIFKLISIKELFNIIITRNIMIKLHFVHIIQIYHRIIILQQT